jgi:hypothetical protein
MNRLVFSSVVAIAFALGAPAIARGDGALSAAAKTAAQQRYSKGLELYAQALRTHDQGTFESAYLQFVQAFSIYPDDKVLWNLAVAANDTNRFVEALHRFRAFNEHQRAAENEKHPQHDLIVQYLDQLTKKTSHVDVDAPPGARIELDGQSAGTAPLPAPIDLLPGTHDFSANVSGTFSHVRVDALAGSHSAVRLGYVEVAPLPQPAPAITASIAPTPSPDANRDAGPSESRTLVTARNATVLGLGVGTVAAVVAGIGFKVGASNQSSTEASLGAQGASGSCAGSGSSRCLALSQAASDRSSDNSAASGFFIAGGALAATGIVLLLLWHDPQATPSGAALHVVPSVSPTAGGFQLTGTF